MNATMLKWVGYIIGLKIKTMAAWHQLDCLMLIHAFVLHSTLQSCRVAVVTHAQTCVDLLEAFSSILHVQLQRVDLASFVSPVHPAMFDPNHPWSDVFAVLSSRIRQVPTS